MQSHRPTCRPGSLPGYNLNVIIMQINLRKICFPACRLQAALVSAFRLPTNDEKADRLSWASGFRPNIRRPSAERQGTNELSSRGNAYRRWVELTLPEPNESSFDRSLGKMSSSWEFFCVCSFSSYHVRGPKSIKRPKSHWHSFFETDLKLNVFFFQL